MNSEITDDRHRVPTPYVNRPIPAKEVLLDKTDPSWRLYHRPAARRGPWHTLVLRRTGPALPKRSYRLGWNGARLANGKDAQILLDHDPDIYAWVEITCSSSI